jgi:hypothetical protein
MKKAIFILALLLIAAPVYGATDVKNDASLPTNLVSYWRMEETSGSRIDTPGSNDLTDNNTVTSGTGIQGTAASFDENNGEYLTMPAAAGLSNVNAYTVAFWLNCPSGSSDAPQVISIDAAGRTAGDFRFIKNVGGTITLVMDTGAADQVIAGTTNVCTGGWHHIAWTGDGSTMKLYIDGSQEGGNVASTINLNTANRVWYFGVRFGLVETDYYNGLMDEVGVWTRALSSTEVSALYNGGTGIPYEAPPAPTPAFGEGIIWFNFF